MFARRLLVFLVLTFAVPAQASDGLAVARDAFAKGDFEQAARLARGLATSRGKALAARAELAAGDFLAPPDERRECFERAEKYARAAISLNPDNPEGHLYLALALGFMGRMEGSVAAHFAGYAEEARRHIARALELAPNSPWANALLGGWNLEIVHDGGFLGETIYGASVAKGDAAYRRALSFDPSNAAIAYQYALQLVALGGALRRAEARQVLSDALESDPGDAFERLASRRADRLKLALETHNEAELDAILRDRLGNALEPLKPGRVTGSPTRSAPSIEFLPASTRARHRPD